MKPTSILVIITGINGQRTLMNVYINQAGKNHVLSFFIPNYLLINMVAKVVIIRTTYILRFKKMVGGKMNIQ